LVFPRDKTHSGGFAERQTRDAACIGGGVDARPLTEMTTVYIVSSSQASRQALRRLAESPEVRVAGDGDDLQAFAASATAAQVLVLDDVQWLGGLQEGEEHLNPAVVVLAREPGAAVDALRALDVPGWAVLPRGATAAELRAAIAAAAAGLAVLPAETAATGLAATRLDVGGNEDREGESDIREEALTGREQEVLGLLGLGLSNKEIGVRLAISEHTAKFHVASVLAKLGAHNRAEAVHRGIRRGLVAV
jgi:DNA-binding NarL/FixJ family response regulator